MLGPVGINSVGFRGIEVGNETIATKNATLTNSMLTWQGETETDTNRRLLPLNQYIEVTNGTELTIDGPPAIGIGIGVKNGTLKLKENSGELKLTPADEVKSWIWRKQSTTRVKTEAVPGQEYTLYPGDKFEARYPRVKTP